MTDFLGSELKVGDTVVFANANYQTLAKGRVNKLGPKMVVIEAWYGWGRAKIVNDPEQAASYARRITRYPQDVVKVSENED